MKPAEPKWTPDQKTAINTADKNVFVSASAGTGKTAVLAKRCARFLADKKIQTQPEQILVLTFTNAAAEEMQSRIAAQLRTEFKNTKSPHVRKNLLMLDATYIGTIHAFCKKTITENFHLLNIDPAFRVIEEDEQKLLKTEALNETIDQAWENPSLTEGLQKLLYRRNLNADDYGFCRKIIQLSNYLDSTVSRTDWYKRATLLAEAAAQSRLVENQKQRILRKLHFCTGQLKYARKLAKNLMPASNWPEIIEQNLLTAIDDCVDKLKKDNLAACSKISLD